jgi:hypothetical protein
VSSLKLSSYIVQGIEIDLLVEDCLSFYVSEYFNPLYEGEYAQNLIPVKIELRIVNDQPNIPSNSVRVINSPLVTFYSDNNRVYFLSKSGSIIFLDQTLKKVKGFLKQEIIKNPCELFSLLGSAIVEILKYYGCYFLHAAALNVNKVAYLFSGDGGCGKTTIALSLVREGYNYVSDDSIFLRENKGAITISPMYKHFHIDQDLAKHFPELSRNGMIGIPEGTKAPLDISSLFPNSFVPFLTPDIIIFPKMTSNRRSMLNRLSQTESYRRLLKQTVLAVNKNISLDQLRVLEKLVKQTKGFELSNGRDIYEDPKILIDLLNEVNH